jgi:hypothetical protein
MRAQLLKALGQDVETPRNQAPKISFETSSMITSKLKERAAKTRRGMANKKIFEKQDKPPASSQMLQTKSSIDNLNERYYHQPGDGFSEKICKQNLSG